MGMDILGTQNTMKHIFALTIVFCFVVIMLPAQQALADCTDPVGKKGEIRYNSDYQAFQGCDGTNWMAFHTPVCPAGTGCDPCETGPIGTMCTSDNAIYAGTTVGGVRMYAARCDHGQSWDGSSCTGSAITLRWKTSSTATAGTGDSNDGVDNTDAMATAGIADHPAAEACRNIGPEWYLPALNELDDLYTNLADTGVTPGNDFDFDTSGVYYWSSTQVDTWSGWTRRFDGAATQSNFKGIYNNVRCVRR